MSNIVTIRRNLQAFLRNKFDGNFNNYIAKTLNFYELGSQSGVVVDEMTFIDDQENGSRQISVWMAFPVLSRVGDRPDLEDAYEKALSLADKMALEINRWVGQCSNTGARGSGNLRSSAQVLPIDNVRNIVKATDTPATTSPTITPTPTQPLTASFYAISVVKFELEYFAFEP